MESKIISEAITFDDVLLQPAYSDVVPSDADTSTNLTNNIRLNIPLLSSPMDTVTEAKLAIALAQQGGLGVIHKNLSVKEQVREVIKVKRSANGIITDPITVRPDILAGNIRQIMAEQNISGVPVTENGRTDGKVVGIITRRDMMFLGDDNKPVSEVMTKQRLITGAPDTTLEQAESILNQNKVEKLLLVDKNNYLTGLITMRDVVKLKQYPFSCRDKRGRLRVGAAVGVHQLERVEALIGAEVDVITVDSAHGHSKNILETVKSIKAKYNIDVIAGNVATEKGATDLIQAGVDAVKVGIGPGSICTTRVVTGIGMPQITAIMNGCQAAQKYAKQTGQKPVPVIADGGVRHSGDITKAIAAGASCVMLGSLFAGLDESPGEVVISMGRRYKSYRGMGSQGAMMAGSADRYGQDSKSASKKLVPEGVEGRVAYRGSLVDFTYQMIGGLRAGMGYCGTQTIEQLQRDSYFVKISAASVIEGHPHDITITKETPNYSMGQRIIDE